MIESAGRIWAGAVTIRIPRLNGHLTGTDGRIPLTGHFVAKREPSGLARLPRNAVRKVPLMGSQLAKVADSLAGHPAASEWDSWEVWSQFKLEFDAVKIEFDAKNTSVRRVSGDMYGGMLASPKVQCKGLLEKIQRLTWQTEESIDHLTGQINRIYDEPAELLSRHWQIAILWLGIGQEKKAFNAINSGKQVIDSSLGPAGIGQELSEIGRQLIAQLENSGHQRKASGIEALLGQAGCG